MHLKHIKVEEKSIGRDSQFFGSFVEKLIVVLVMASPKTYYFLVIRAWSTFDSQCQLICLS